MGNAASKCSTFTSNGATWLVLIKPNRYFRTAALRDCGPLNDVGTPYLFFYLFGLLGLSPSPTGKGLPFTFQLAANR